MNDVVIKYEELPFFVKGYTRENVDGDYIIVVNINRCEEVQRKTIEHEMKHLRNDDFNNDLSISIIEGT